MIILVLNVGLKNARCIAFNDQGLMLAQASRPVHTYVSNERVEQDPDEWLSHTKEVIGTVITCLGNLKTDIKYLTVTTSASCLTVVDKAGKPLRKAILVSDTRSVQQAKKLAAFAEFKALKKEGFKSSPDLMLPKIMWLAEHEPQVFFAAFKYLNISDFLLAYLTGEYVTDYSNALKFYYSLQDQSYPRELLQALGLATQHLPHVVSPGCIIGTVRTSVVEALSLPGNCEVIMATYDALAAVAGNGAFREGDGVDISGTVTSFRVVTKKHVCDPLNRFYITPHADKQHWLVGGSNNLGGGIIEWLRDLSYKNASTPYLEMEADAKKCSPCPGGLIFLPHLLGERAPIWNPDCRAVFFGINRAHQKHDFTRAVFEGVAFSTMHIASVLKEFSINISQITVAGGLSRVETINQIKSDLFGLPVHQFKNFETTAIGAALIALVGIGRFANLKEAFSQFCSLEKTYEPNLQNHSIYQEYFHLYLQVYEALRSCYQTRVEILNNLLKNGINELVLTDNL